MGQEPYPLDTKALLVFCQSVLFVSRVIATRATSAIKRKWPGMSQPYATIATDATGSSQSRYVRFWRGKIAVGAVVCDGRLCHFSDCLGGCVTHRTVINGALTVLRPDGLRVKIEHH